MQNKNIQDGFVLQTLRKKGEVGMTYTQLLFIALEIALNIAICITTLVMVNTTQQMLYDFKKEFRRFRDGEQYQCQIYAGREREG